jgi:hypothetical protein
MHQGAGIDPISVNLRPHASLERQRSNGDNQEYPEEKPRRAYHVLGLKFMARASRKRSDREHQEQAHVFPGRLLVPKPLGSPPALLGGITNPVGHVQDYRN